MTDKQVKMISEAIKELAASIRDLGDRVANDEPLNYSVARGLAKIAEAIQSRA